MTKMDDFRREFKLDIKYGTCIIINNVKYIVIGNNSKQLKVKDSNKKIHFIDPHSKYEIIKTKHILSAQQTADFLKSVNEGWSLRKCLSNANINHTNQEKYENQDENELFREILLAYYLKTDRFHPNLDRLLIKMGII